MKKQTTIHSGARFARRVSIALAIAAGGSAITIPAFAQTADHTASHAAMKNGAAPMDMHGSMMKMQEQMDAVKPSGYVDLDFAVMMRIHHQGALDMAQMELDKGKDPELRKMAEEIIAAQKKEIVVFEQWIAKHKTAQK